MGAAARFRRAEADPQETLRAFMLTLLNQLGWVRPADDPLTAMLQRETRGRGEYW